MEVTHISSLMAPAVLAMQAAMQKQSSQHAARTMSLEDENSKLRAKVKELESQKRQWSKSLKSWIERGGPVSGNPLPSFTQSSSKTKTPPTSPSLNQPVPKTPKIIAETPTPKPSKNPAGLSQSSDVTDINSEEPPYPLARKNSLLKKRREPEQEEEPAEKKQKKELPANPYTKYKEVVRGKEARAAMPAYACDECKRFFDSVCADDPNGVFDKEFMIKNACRHRAKWKPEATPPEFWNLSFPDERDQHNFTQDKI